MKDVRLAAFGYRALHKLRDATPDRFAAGAVRYGGRASASFGEDRPSIPLG